MVFPAYYMINKAKACIKNKIVKKYRNDYTKTRNTEV